MKVAFVHLGREHLGIQYLSSALKGSGHDVSLLCDSGLFSREDNVFYIPSLARLFDQRRHILSELTRLQPDLIAFSPYTSTYKWCCDMARRVKIRLDAPIVFGGIHTTLVPEQVIANEHVDYVVVGEGEEAIVELADALEQRRPDLRIQNLWHKRGGDITHNTLRPLISDLDTLPLPDKELFAQEVRIEDDYMIMASRGCHFRCSYCCESSMTELYGSGYHRRRSPASVIHELEVMKQRHGFRRVIFNDALFFTHEAWLRELLEEYEQKIGVPYRCYGNTRFLTDEVARMLKRSGCYCIQFGMQTVNESLKRDVLARRESNDRVIEALKICDRHGLPYDMDHILGLPGESLQDHVDAARFYSGLEHLNRIKSYNFTFFPRTQITEYARKSGVLSDGDVRDIEEGTISDFFHIDLSKDREAAVLNRSFHRLFKIEPLLTRRAVSLIVDRGLYRQFHRLPGATFLALQLLVALKNRDYRYAYYIKYYLHRIDLLLAAERAP